MQTVLRCSVGESLREFALAVGAANRVFTLHQLARHPILSWRSQPVKRWSEFLRPYAGDFEKLPGPHGQPFRFRLSKAARKRLGVRDKPISGMSQHSEHWLALGDVWIALTLNGGQPNVWILEPRDSAGYDVFFVWQRYAFIAEVQRTPITKQRWEQKWKRRMQWFTSGAFREAPWQRKGMVVRPTVLVVDMMGSEVKHPEGVCCVTLENIASRVRRFVSLEQRTVSFRGLLNR